MSVTSVAIQFTIVDMLSKGISTIKDRLQSLSSTSKEVKRDFDRMTSSFKWAAMTGIATREMYKGMKPAVNLAGDLQSEMIGVRAELMGAGKDAKTLTDELKQLKGTAFAVQAWSPFDMTQIVALEKELIKAGASVEQIQGKAGAAAAAAALATYEGVNPAETGKALVSIATPFKITGDRFMELADLVSRASSASTADIMDIVYAAKYASGPLAALGKSTKEMLALSALMAQRGMGGETGGRAIREFFQQAAKVEGFRDAKGNLLSTQQIVEKLEKSMKKLGTAERQDKLREIFGELGGAAALALLEKGEVSFEAMTKAMEESVSLQDKVNERMKGFKVQLDALKGTAKSTIADLFQPALPVLTSLVSKTNDFITAIGKASQEKEWLGKLVTRTSAATLGIGAAATLGLGTAGVLYGRKVLKGVGGIKGLLSGAGSDTAGIVKGKAVEAATGVTPVFVTNWPANFGTSDATAAKSIIDLGKKTKDLLTVGGTIGTGTSTAVVGGTALATYGAYKGTIAAAEGTTKYLQSGEEGSFRKKLFDLMTGKTPVISHEKAVTNNILKEKAVNTVLSEKAVTNNILKEKAVNTVLSEKAERVIQTEKVIEGSKRNTGKAGEIKNYLNIQIDKDGRVFQDGNMKTEIKVDRGQF